MTVIQPASNASNNIIVSLKIDLAVPPSSRLDFAKNLVARVAILRESFSVAQTTNS